MEDTIAAIATPLGVGAIGIVRVSGPMSKAILRSIFVSSKKVEDYKSHRLYHGFIFSSETGKAIDEVLISLMLKPNSYTGEDTLEINCHGGIITTRSILAEVLKAGARIAEPGEFTKRAFLNNRIDLTQAEAITDIITAKTERGLELAVSQLQGNLASKLEAIYNSILDILAILEASIDFSDEDVDVIDNMDVDEKLRSILSELKDLLATYKQGMVYKLGITALIIGRPNVGKSSLMNVLLGEKRAIVTPLPGTTRDFIEETINIEGVSFKLIDTAGIRSPENIIEKEGINLVWEKLPTADIVIAVFDGSQDLTEEDETIINELAAKKVLIVINKADLHCKLGDSGLRKLSILGAAPPLWVSAKFGQGISELKNMLHSLSFSDVDEHKTDHFITNIRHKEFIEKAFSFLSKAKNSLMEGLSSEFVAFDVKEALDSLGAITGKTFNEDVVNRIFSTFCIGK